MKKVKFFSNNVFNPPTIKDMIKTVAKPALIGTGLGTLTGTTLLGGGRKALLAGAITGANIGAAIGTAMIRGKRSSIYRNLGSSSEKVKMLNYIGYKLPNELKNFILNSEKYKDIIGTEISEASGWLNIYLIEEEDISPRDVEIYFYKDSSKYECHVADNIENFEDLKSCINYIKNVSKMPSTPLSAKTAAMKFVKIARVACR